MKNSTLIFAMILGMSAIIFNSCTKNTDTVTPNNTPIISNYYLSDSLCPVDTINLLNYYRSSYIMPAIQYDNAGKQIGKMFIYNIEFYNYSLHSNFQAQFALADSTGLKEESYITSKAHLA